MTRRILIAVAGTTVATVTEALWALAVDRALAIDELKLFVTAGALKTIDRGIGPALAALRADYPRASIPDEATLRVIESDKGDELEDIRDSADNEVLADWILGEVRHLCSDPDVEVHASLTGGRKTMSFYLGAAMQLCARPQDRLYHVLVAPEFEVPGFLYPKPAKAKDRMIKLEGIPNVDASKAKVDLAEVPFVRLSPLLKDEGVDRFSFNQLIARADDMISDDYGEVHVIPREPRTGKAVIRFKFSEREIVELSSRNQGSKDFVFYTWLLHRAREGKGPVEFLRTADKLTTFQSNLDDYIQWCELLGIEREKLKTALDWESNLQDARRAYNQGNPIPLDELIMALNEEFKVYPSRIAKLLTKEFHRHAPNRAPAKYKVILSSGWHLTVPPEKIHFHLPKPAKRHP